MTPRQYQSGQTDWSGRITKCGDEMVRTALYEAAQVILRRTSRWCSLKAWGMKIAKHRGMEKSNCCGRPATGRHPAPDVG